MNTLRCAKTSDIGDEGRRFLSRYLENCIGPEYWAGFYERNAPITESYLTKRATLSVASDNLRECG